MSGWQRYHRSHIKLSGNDPNPSPPTCTIFVGECQGQAWRLHKKECTALQAERSQYKSEKKAKQGSSAKPPVPVEQGEASGGCVAASAGADAAADARTGADTGAGADAEAEDGFKRGDVVVLKGLKNAAHLNGERGVILGQAKDGRFPVRLNLNDKKVVIKPANMTHSM